MARGFPSSLWWLLNKDNYLRKNYWLVKQRSQIDGQNTQPIIHASKTMKLFDDKFCHIKKKKAHHLGLSYKPNYWLLRLQNTTSEKNWGRTKIPNNGVCRRVSNAQEKQSMRYMMRRTRPPELKYQTWWLLKWNIISDQIWIKSEFMWRNVAAYPKKDYFYIYQ